MEKVKVRRDFLFVFIMASTGAFSEKNLLIFFLFGMVQYMLTYLSNNLFVTSLE